jgi:hypothetical protein
MKMNKQSALRIPRITLDIAEDSVTATSAVAACGASVGIVNVVVVESPFVAVVVVSSAKFQ